MNTAIRIYREKEFDTITVSIYRNQSLFVKCQAGDHQEVHKIIDEYWDAVVDSEGE